MLRSAPVARRAAVGRAALREGGRGLARLPIGRPYSSQPPEVLEWEAKAASIDAAMRKEHTKPIRDHETRIRRLVYRAKQRGWLEVDLLMGSWAQANAGGLSQEELDDFEELLNFETTEIYKFLTAELEPPEHLVKITKKVRAHSYNQTIASFASPEKYGAFKSSTKMSN